MDGIAVPSFSKAVRIGANLSYVQHTANRVAIVATGPSLRGVDLHFPEGVSVIAVNGAGGHWRGNWYLPEPPAFWFTTDLTSKRNRDILQNPRQGTMYYAAVDDGFTCNTPHAILLRRIVGKGPKFSRQGLSDDPTGIHCGNSAYGALGLAYLMGATRIALLGVDGTRGKYAFGSGRPRDLRHLPKLFASAVPQLEAAGVQAVNGSPESTVTCWSRMRPEAAIEWLAA